MDLKQRMKELGLHWRVVGQRRMACCLAE